MVLTLLITPSCLELQEITMPRRNRRRVTGFQYQLNVTGAQINRSKHRRRPNMQLNSFLVGEARQARKGCCVKEGRGANLTVSNS
jgi:hypothetical protein